MGIVTPDGVTVKTPTPIETLPFSAISLELPSIIDFIDARNLLGLPSGIGPVGTPISCKFCTVFKNDLVAENPSKDFAANEVKFVQKKFSAHKENLLNEMPKSSEDTSDNGKSR